MRARSARQVSFSNHRELMFNQGTVLQSAITVGDVDNDSDNELVVGSFCGMLLVYKGLDQKTAKYECQLDGSISCVMVGDVWGKGTNSIVAIVAEGLCYIFDVKSDLDEAKASLQQQLNCSDGVEGCPPSMDATGDEQDRESSSDESYVDTSYISKSVVKIMPTTIFQFPCNVSACLLEDIYNMEKNILVVGTRDGESDSKVYMFSFHSEEKRMNSSSEMLSVPLNISEEKGVPISHMEQLANWKVPGDVVTLSSCLPKRKTSSGSQCMSKTSEKRTTHYRVTRMVIVGLLYNGFLFVDPLSNRIIIGNQNKKFGDRFENLNNSTSPLTHHRSTSAASTLEKGTSVSNMDETMNIVYGPAQQDSSGFVIDGEEPLITTPTLVIGGITTIGNTLKYNSNNTDDTISRANSVDNDIFGSTSVMNKASGSSLMSNASLESRLSTMNESELKVEEELVAICSLSGELVFQRVIANCSQDAVDSSNTLTEKQENSSLEGITPTDKQLSDDSMDTNLVVPTMVHVLQCAKREPEVLGCNLETVWGEMLSAQTLAIFAEDITEDHYREIVTCAWDGLTCIYDQNRNAIRFKFQGRVQAFYVAKLSVKPGVIQPCFIYVTFDKRIIIYPNITGSIRAVPSRTMIHELNERKQLSKVMAILNRHASKKLRKDFTSELGDVGKSYRLYAWRAKLINEALYGSLRIRVKQLKRELEGKLPPERNPSA